MILELLFIVGFVDCLFGFLIWLIIFFFLLGYLGGNEVENLIVFGKRVVWFFVFCLWVDELFYEIYCFIFGVVCFKINFCDVFY